MKTITKKIKIATLLFFLSTSILLSQQVITKDQVTPQKLASIFKDAYIEVLSVQNTYIKVKDVFTTFLDIDSKKRYVSISGNYRIQPNTPKSEILDLINKINREVILIKCYYKASNNSINYYYYFWIEGGFTPTSLVKAFKIYNSALTLSLQKDVNKIIK
ncbi:MAG: YbjN domain-containing protein [Lutibacter sp.]